MSRLAVRRHRPHNGSVEDAEATQLMLEPIFDIRGRVRDIHEAIFGGEDGEEEEEAEEDT
jgi:hypothetical protein